MADEAKKPDTAKVLEQFRKEKTSAMKARQVRIDNWSQNEKLYNGQPTMTLLTRSNLHVPKVFEGVQTMSAKIGQLPEVEFDTKPEGDENASDLMKANWQYDVARSDLDKLWQYSKTENGIYGQAIYKLIPSNEGNKFELVDTMAFLVSPIAKTIKDTLYCGQQFIYKTLDQIEENAAEFGYDEDEIKKMKEAKPEADLANANSQERSIRDLRLSYMGYANVTDLGSKMVELTEWYTFIKKEKYVLTVANDTYLLRCTPIKEVGLPRWPYVSWASYPRGVAFWTPSVADILRDPNLAMNVSINQLIDNNTYRNFGMKYVSSSSGLKQASITPRPLGLIVVNTGEKGINDVVKEMEVPAITEASQTLMTLNGIAETAVGLSGTPMGQGQKKASVTQASAHMALAESKTNLIKQNAVEAIEELAQLYADTLTMNLTKPRSIKVYGNKPTTIDGVTKSNFKDVEFIAKATSPDTNKENKAIKQKARGELYTLFKDDPKVPGQKFLRQSVAKEFEYTPTEIDKLFTAEEPVPGQQPAAQLGPDGQPIPTNPENPQLSQTGAAAQANVPPAIR